MEVIMPKLGLTMTQGTIVEWLKHPGERVAAEESLCTYETEKVTLELPSPAAGVVGEILAPTGAVVPAGGVVCTVVAAEAAGEPASPVQASITATPKARSLARARGIDLSRLTGRGPGGRVHAEDVVAAKAAPAATGAPAADVAPAAAAAPVVLRATPLARRIASEKGVDLSAVRGTGPDGTITREDVEAAAAHATHPSTAALRASAQDALVSGDAPSKHPERSAAESKDAAPGGTLIPHSALRRTIAERMTQSAFTAPHVTLTTEAEATNLVSARGQLNEELPKDERISYNALFAALVAVALREHPGVNARWETDGIRLLPEINIALAVDTERGLMTPVLTHVDRLSLPQIQAGYAVLAARALAGKSLPGDFEGGTFTITNLGGLDIDAFTPIINPSQAAILGVGRIVERVVPRDGQAVIRPMMALSLSFDHRVVDGAPAARFLQRVKQLVERPLTLLLRR